MQLRRWVCRGVPQAVAQEQRELSSIVRPISSAPVVVSSICLSALFSPCLMMNQCSCRCRAEQLRPVHVWPTPTHSAVGAPANGAVSLGLSLMPALWCLHHHHHHLTPCLHCASACTVPSLPLPLLPAQSPLLTAGRRRWSCCADQHQEPSNSSSQ